MQRCIGDQSKRCIKDDWDVWSYPNSQRRYWSSAIDEVVLGGAENFAAMVGGNIEGPFLGIGSTLYCWCMIGSSNSHKAFLESYSSCVVCRLQQSIAFDPRNAASYLAPSSFFIHVREQKTSTVSRPCLMLIWCSVFIRIPA